MKISKCAVTKICQWLENKNLSILADDLYSSEVKTEFRYLLSLYDHHTRKFIFPSERIFVYKDSKRYPTVLWNLNSQWKENLTDYEDLGKINEQIINNNFQHFIS